MTVGEPEINLNTWGIRYEIIKAPAEQEYVASKDPKTLPKKKPKGKKEEIERQAEAAHN